MALPLDQLPDWPAAMDRQTAMAYTSVAEKQMRMWQRAGFVRFRPSGPHGALLALRADLDDALRTLFEDAADCPIEF